MKDWLTQVPGHDNGHVAFDLDGTLAYYDTWRGMTHIGEPIKPMVDLLKSYLAQGEEVRILTARASRGGVDGVIVRTAIKAWCKEHIGVELEVTATKDYGMKRLYDDRAVTIEANTGKILTVPYHQHGATT